jgi:signal transduction histidine kinase
MTMRNETEGPGSGGRALAPARLTASAPDAATALAECEGALKAASRTIERLVEERLAESRRLDALGRLSSGIAHDFKNMLTVIDGTARRLGARLPPEPDTVVDLNVIGQAVDRALALAQQLLTSTRLPEGGGPPEPVNLVIEQSLPLLRRIVGSRVRIALDLDPAAGLVAMPASHVEQVLINLVLNAGDAMPEGGPIWILTRGLAPTEPGAAGRVSIAVRDAGVGMDAATSARVFEPFFTTKPPDRGWGLGLATVQAMVARAGGDIRVESAPGWGSTFTIVLPCRERV